MPRIAVVLVVAGPLFSAGCATASPPGGMAPTARAASGVRLVTVGRFKDPLYVTAPAGDTHRIYVLEQAGRVMVVKDGRKLAAPFLDITGEVRSGDEEGMLGLAFAPDFAKSGLFYVYYTAGDGAQQVVEYHAAGPDQADPNSARVVLRMPDPRPNDNGGDLEFGPDGLLYIGTGDGGDLVNQPPPGNSQDLGSLFGKLLRIDPRAQGSLDYTIPTGNPFLHRAGARPEIYSYGLRNPWRFSFDRRTGAIAIGDVGGSRSEEIDYAAKGHARGANYGWRLFEGNLPYEKGSAHGLVKPVLTHSHSKGWCAISGGYVVRDPSLPALAGRYVYSDLCEGHIWAVRLHSGGAKGDGRLHVRSVPTVDSFGEDARGRVYVVSHNGPVYRLAAR